MSARAGGWLLGDRLGGGGNADVFHAVHDDGREAAVKILRAKSRRSERFQRFEDEVQILNSLVGTPGVLPLIEYCTDTAPYWHATALATPIRDAIGNHPGSLVTLTHIRSIAATLADLAEAGVSHRDIKPSNLLVLDDSPVVSDFGLATYPGKREITTDARQLGPQNFLAPEMLTGPANAVGSSADVWSLAKTLWVLLNRCDWPPPGPQRAGEPSSRIAIDDLPVGRIRQLEFMIERSTRMEPTERPTMPEISAELDAVLGGDPSAIAGAPDLQDLGARIAPLNALLDRDRHAQDAAVKECQELMEHYARCVQPIAVALHEVGIGHGAFMANSLILDSVLAHERGDRRWLHKVGHSVDVIHPAPRGQVVFFAGGGVALLVDGNVLIVTGYQVGADAGSRFGVSWREAAVGSALAEQHTADLAHELASDLRRAVELFVADVESLSA